MSDVEIRWVGDLQRCEVKTGDRFVLSVDTPISDEVAKSMREQWKLFIGGDVPIIILSPGMKLGVIGSVPE